MTVYQEIEILCDNARAAAATLALADSQKKNSVLMRISQALLEDADSIIEANEKDLAFASENGVPSAMIDRLRLTKDRIESICASVRDVALLEDPVGKGEVWSRPSGIEINRIRVPLGVVAIIYEARPNVTVDSAVLCLKTGNAVVLRGGKEAINTNKSIVNSLKRAVSLCELDPHCIELVTNTDRESANALMSMRGKIDVLIPRGGKGLIQSVTQNAKVPVIETGAGNCHLYIDDSADIDMAISIALNAKCSRPSVCNAIESVLVHAGVAGRFLPEFAKVMAEYKVEIRGCAKTCVLVPQAKSATDEDYYTEYNDFIGAVKVVDTLNDARAHINKHSTAHSEAIVTSNEVNAEKFQKRVNSAAVYVTASTRFTDGGEFGFGAEIGISTQKLHVRGPMGLSALTTEKYLIRGEGSIR
ncbi:MAG: glutamate-5-semialdehyde dehydrogenase [Clostridia bacterium]|nr:glutamate-5-semialdehyde dehydrogenase [Clostridia bacterium]